MVLWYGKMNKIMKKKVKKTERHIRWNWEESSDNLNHVRYHLIVVDDDSQSREKYMDRLLGVLSKYSSLQLIRQDEGKVKNSKMRYILRSYDCLANPNDVEREWKLQFAIPIIRDERLREPKKGTLEDKVAAFYDPEC